MVANVRMTLTREMLVSMLAAYGTTALPSAMLNILRDALAESAARIAEHDPKGAAWAANVASELAADVRALRTDEDRIFLAGEEV